MAVENITVRIGANIRDFERKMGQLQSRMDRIGSGMQSIGTKMSAAITLPLAAAGGYAIKTGMDFDDAMAKVSAVSGATGSDLESLRQKAKDMGATTRFSASEAAEGLNYMALAGWSTDEMLSGLDGVMSLAAASGEELGTVSDIVTDSLSAFGLEAKDSAEFADVLAATSANANTDVAGLGAAFQYVAPVAGALGFTVEDTAKAIGLMSDNGIKGEKAGTALRTMMTNLASPTAAMKEEMDKLGISLTNTDGTMKTFDEIMVDLRDSFSDLTEEQQASAAATIFGKESMSGALAIINTTEDSFDNLGDAINNSEGAAQTMAETMEDTLGGTWREIKSGIEGLAISIYEAMLPALEKMADAFLGVVQWLNDLSPEMKQLGVVIGVVAAAIGPLLAIGGTMLIWFSSLTKSIGLLAPVVKGIGAAFTFLTGPIGLTIAAIVGIGAAFVLAYNNSETFRNFIDGLRDKFTDAWESAMEFKDKVVDAFNGILAIFKGDHTAANELLRGIGLSEENIDNVFLAVTKIQNFFKDMKESIQTALDGVSDFFIDQFQGIRSWWDSDGELILSAVTTTFEWAMDAISDAVQFGLDFVVSLFQTFAPIVEGIWNTLWPTIEFIAKNTWSTIELAIGTAMDVIQGIISAVSAIIEGDWEAFGTILKDTALSIKDRVVEHFGNMKDNAIELINNLTGGAIDKFIEMKDGVVEWMKNLIEDVYFWWERLKRDTELKVREMVASVKQFFSDLWENVTGTAKNIKDGVVNRFTELKDNAINRIKGAYDGVTGWFSDMKSNVSDAASNLKSSVTDRFTELKDNAINRVSSAYDGVTGWFGDIYTNTKNKAGDIRDSVSDRFGTMKENTVEAAKSMWSGVSDFFSDIKDDATSLFSDLVDGAKELPGRIGDAIKNMASHAVDGAKAMGNSLANGLENVINGVIGGLNSLLSKIGMDDPIPNVSIARFSTGTGGGNGRVGAHGNFQTFSTGTRNGRIAEDMLGILNDRGPGNGRGGAVQELIERNGQLLAPQGKDVLVPLKTGDRIYSGAEVQSLISSGVIPRFSRGTGTDGGNSGTESKGLFSRLGDIVSNVWDFIAEPKKAFDAVLNSVTSTFDGLTGFAGKFARGAFNLVKEGGLSFLTSMFEKSGGLGTGKAVSFMNYRMTTPYSPNSPVPGYPRSFNGGRHYGIDYGTPSGTPVHAPTGGKLSSFWNTGGGLIAKLVTGQLRQFFMHMSSVEPSGSVKAGDFIGRTGNSGQWTTGPHIHWQAQQGTDVLNRNTVNPLDVIGHRWGGIFNKRHLAEIAEDGPEAVIPLSSSKRGRANQILDNVDKRVGRDDSKHYDKMIENQQQQINQMQQAIGILMGIESKTGFDPGRANKAINKHVDDRTILY